MKRIIENFLNRFISLLSAAIENKLSQTVIKAQVDVKYTEHKTIDELVLILEHTVFEDADRVEIIKERCNGYQIKIYKGDEVHIQIPCARNLKALFQGTISETSKIAFGMETDYSENNHA